MHCHAPVAAAIARLAAKKARKDGMISKFRHGKCAKKTMEIFLRNNANRFTGKYFNAGTQERVKKLLSCVCSSQRRHEAASTWNLKGLIDDDKAFGTHPKAVVRYLADVNI